MNFIGILDGGETSVELKYCERCGGLFLRRLGVGVIHCVGCTSRLTKKLDSAATHWGTRRTNRGVRAASATTRKLTMQGNAQLDCLQGVAIEGMPLC